MCGMVLIAVSPLTAAQIMLLLDRFLGAHFFDTQAGGSAILWQHFFWIFGHPEVYILVLPAFAFANEIIPVFSRKAIFGYRPWWRRRFRSPSSAWACGRITCSPSAWDRARTRSSPCRR